MDFNECGGRGIGGHGYDFRKIKNDFYNLGHMSVHSNHQMPKFIHIDVHVDM